MEFYIVIIQYLWHWFTDDDDLDVYQNDVFNYEMQDADAIMEDDVTPYDVDADANGIVFYT